MYCTKLKINFVEEIRKDIFTILPPDFATFTRGGAYINGWKNTTQLILSLESVQKLLKAIKVDAKSVKVCGFTVTMPGDFLLLHIDKGPFKLSLNVPMTDTSGSFLNFYTCSSEPFEVNNGLNVYYSVKEEDCTLAESVHTDSPCLVDTTVPHKIYNNTDKVRVMLLIRLDESIDFSDIVFDPASGVEAIS